MNRLVVTCISLSLGLLMWLGGPEPVFGEPRLPRDQYKSGETVRGAFREIVAAANLSTVEILGDEKRVAFGTIVDASGGVLTKASQLTGALRCRLKDGQTYDARIIGIDDALDLAYLQIDEQNLPVVEWDRSQEPAVGQWLATTGMDEIPVAVGIVSIGKRRPPDQKGFLGVHAENSDDGPRVTQIFPKSAAEEAGLEIGDVILRIGEIPVSNDNELADAIGRHDPGKVIAVEILRDGDQSTLRVTLGHPAAAALSRGGFMNQLGGRLSRRRSGFSAVLQHDTVLQPEDCGGPVVGLSGKAIGINIARAGRTETYALPSEIVLSVLNDLRTGRLPPPEPNTSDLPVPASSKPKF